MSSEFEITVATAKGDVENVSTDGYILFYLEGADKIKVKGNLNNKALMPIVTKLMMDKLSRQ